MAQLIDRANRTNDPWDLVPLAQAAVELRAAEGVEAVRRAADFFEAAGRAGPAVSLALTRVRRVLDAA